MTSARSSAPSDVAMSFVDSGTAGAGAGRRAGRGRARHCHAQRGRPSTLDDGPVFDDECDELQGVAACRHLRHAAAAGERRARPAAGHVAKLGAIAIDVRGIAEAPPAPTHSTPTGSSRDARCRKCARRRPPDRKWTVVASHRHTTPRPESAAGRSSDSSPTIPYQSMIAPRRTPHERMPLQCTS